MYNWRSLISLCQLCDGAPLASIVFCCDPRVKKCPVLERALRELGLSINDFINVMEKNKVSVPVIDGSCYGNLAFCPSLSVKSRDRDDFLLSRGWGIQEYLEYKFNILLELVRSDLNYVFNKYIIEKYAGVVINTSTGKMLAVVLAGSLELGGFRVLSVEDVVVYDSDISSGYLGVRLPRSIISELDNLVKTGFIKSKSDAVRKALLLFIQSIKNII